MDEKYEHSRELISEAIDEYYPRIAVACSFGKDSMVVLDIARRIRPDIPVFTVMTRFKPLETFEYKDKISKKWHLNIKEYSSSKPIPDNLFKTNPDKCCQILKVEPIKKAVKGLDCWICGLRNTEGRTRKDYKEVENSDGLIKLNPILCWTEADVWRYIACRRIPIHPWYQHGYRSLGCKPCTAPK